MTQVGAGNYTYECLKDFPKLPAGLSFGQVPPSKAAASCHVECDENATVVARARSSVLTLTRATMP